MAENKSQKPEDILKEILSGLQSDDAANRLSAITQLRSFTYSSEAIRNELEKLAANDNNEDVRRDALAVLDLPAQRSVRKHFNKVDQNNRRVLLQEITEWETLGILETQKADLLRHRYDFDLTPPPATRPGVLAQPAISTPEQPPVPPAQARSLRRTRITFTNPAQRNEHQDFVISWRVLRGCICRHSRRVC